MAERDVSGHQRIMRIPVPTFILLALICASSAAARPWEVEVLALHNEERARWRVASLTWDTGLAAAADQWASELARSDRLQHSPKGWRRGQGENLWMGTSGAYPVRAMVGGWLGERRWFRPGLFPNVSTTGNWSDVGHYTQIIARRSTRVGCAIRANRRWTYLVCRYGESGNVDGMPIL